MQIEVKILDGNVESHLRARADDEPVVLGEFEVFSITDIERRVQSVVFSERRYCAQAEDRSQDQVLLLIGVGVGNVVVPLQAERASDHELGDSPLQIGRLVL